MRYLVTVENPVYEDDFVPAYMWFNTLEEARRYKAEVDAEGDWFVVVDIYEVRPVD
jgi:hypothetical protein